MRTVNCLSKRAQCVVIAARCRLVAPSSLGPERLSGRQIRAGQSRAGKAGLVPSRPRPHPGSPIPVSESWAACALFLAAAQVSGTGVGPRDRERRARRPPGPGVRGRRGARARRSACHSPRGRPEPGIRGGPRPARFRSADAGAAEPPSFRARGGARTSGRSRCSLPGRSPGLVSASLGRNLQRQWVSARNAKTNALPARAEPRTQ